MKHIKHWLATMAVLLCCIAASAHDFMVGNVYYKITSPSKFTVAVTYRGSSYHQYAGEYSGAVTIPSTVTYSGKTYTVTSIEPNTFMGCKLTSINLSNTITTIGSRAFQDCNGLTSLTLPEGVAIIEGYAFAGCTGLTSLTLSEGMKTIGDGVFNNCENLTSIICKALTPPSAGNEFFYYLDRTIPVYVPASAAPAYLLDKNWKTFTNIQPIEGGTYVASGICGDNVAWTLTDEGLLRIEGTGDMTSSPWYTNKSSIKSVIIGEGVTSIRDYAFSNCTYLTSITIPESLERIEDEGDSDDDKAFYNCTKLESVHISNLAAWCNIGFEGYNSNPLRYAKYLYLNGEAVTDLVIPNTVTEIRPNAFYNYKNLVSVTIPNSVTRILGGTFEGCKNLVSVNFAKDSKLTDISGFNDCTNLTSISIPESVKNIYSKAFYGCSSLTSITIPGNVVSIESMAFYKCSKLTSITIEGAKSIASGAFGQCSNVESITCKTTTPPTLKSSMSFGVNKDIPVYVPKTSISAYQSATYWKDFTNFQPMVEIIASGTCGYNLTWELTEEGELTIKGNGNMYFETAPWKEYKNEIKSVIILEGVTSVENNAFSGCSGITSVTLPDGLTNIEAYAFSGCSITSINIPNSVTEIEDYAFGSNLTAVHISDLSAWCNIEFRTSASSPLYYAKNLYLNGELVTELTIPNTVTTIKRFAFHGCTSITSVNIPSSVTSIEDYAFDSCSNLTSVSLSEGVVSIGRGVFRSCGFTSIIIPDGVKSIDGEAFENCRNLVSIELPESLVKLWSNVFYECASLTSIVIPKGITSIEHYTFYGCTNLTSVTLPENLEIIKDYAFSRCSNLTSIICKATTPPTLGDSFYLVDESIDIFVPPFSISAYQTAENWDDFTNIQGIPSTLTIGEYGSGTYCSEYALDFSEVDDLKAYAATGYDTETGIVTLTRVMTSQPGMGLFIKGELGEYIVPTLESTSFNTLNMLVGTLENTDLNGTSADGLYANYKYTVKEGDAEPVFYQFADGSTLAAGRAYLQIPTVWLTSATATSISYRVDDGETTDIEDIESGIQNSELIYDLMGRRVQTPSKGSVYIVNGKKIVY